MTRTATIIKQNLPDFRGTAHLYRLDPPFTDEDGDKSQYVVVSASVVPYSGPETYIFPADEDGQIASWSELPGSFRGGLNHEAALTGAGYEVLA